MKSDFSKDTFEVTKHFTRVLMQQGRVQLDADWNEQASILLHYLQTLAADLIGPSGGPTDSLGFEIKVRSQPSPLLLQDLLIGPGRYYVDGILCENEPSALGTAPYVQNQNEIKFVGDVIAAGIATDRNMKRGIWDSAQGRVTYFRQPSYPIDPQDHLPSLLLVYLDVWERNICFLEDPDIREVALGGPDTATRAKLVWQVRVFEPQHLASPPEVTCAGFEEEDLWISLIETLQPPERGHLKARAFVPEESEEPCVVSPAARYRGAENQLYRVEIHRGSADGVPTFKWSRENGSVVFPIQTVAGNTVTLENLGRDDRFGLEVGDWVEVVDEAYTLLGKADPLLRVENIETDTRLVTLSDLPKGNVGQYPPNYPLLRRWDQQQGDSRTGGLTIANDNAAKIVEGDTWLNLEDGVQIQFQTGGTYRTGDYWLIPARTETGDVEWPGPPIDPQALPPHGVEHHYAPLALVFSGSVSANEVAGGIVATPAFGVTDLRHRFAPLAQCCPRIMVEVTPPSTTNTTNTATTAQRKATFTVVVTPTDANLKYSWSVTGGPAPPGSNIPKESNVSIAVTASALTPPAVTEIVAIVTIEGLSAGCLNTFRATCPIP
jgi:hypothetical protein